MVACMRQEGTLECVLCGHSLSKMAGSAKAFEKALNSYNRGDVRTVKLWKTGAEEHIEATVGGQQCQVDISIVEEGDGNTIYAACSCETFGKRDKQQFCHHIMATILHRVYNKREDAYAYIGAFKEYSQGEEEEEKEKEEEEEEQLQRKVKIWMC